MSTAHSSTTICDQCGKDITLTRENPYGSSVSAVYRPEDNGKRRYLDFCAAPCAARYFSEN